MSFLYLYTLLYTRILGFKGVKLFTFKISLIFLSELSDLLLLILKVYVFGFNYEFLYFLKLSSVFLSF